MEKLWIVASIFIGISAEAATIKSIKGNKATLKLTADELNMIQADNLYELRASGNSVGRIKVLKIFPGKGIQGKLQSQTPDIKATSVVSLHEIAAQENSESGEDFETNGDTGAGEETGITPSFGRPETLTTKVGVDFNLILGTHKIESDGSPDFYAGNFSFRTTYKFANLPLALGGHLRNNNITKKVSTAEFDTEAELSFNFTSFGLSVMAIHDFGSFRPYALYEFSTGDAKAELKVTNVFGEVTQDLGTQPFTQHSLTLGGAWILGNFSVGLEYQAVGALSIGSSDNAEPAKANATGLSLNLGYRI